MGALAYLLTGESFVSKTVLRLDVERPELTEARFTITKHAKDITAPAAKNNIFQWPLTGSYTLQPINLTTDFSETSHWEQLKYRLADCTYSPDWFKEVPLNNTPGVGPCDYFMHGIVAKQHYDPKTDPNLFHQLIGVLTDTAIGAINFEQNLSVSVMVSKAQQPVNAGFCLRFRIEGREATRRAAILDFIFGQFVLRLNSDGEAQLWQSADFVTYGYVYSWQWAHRDQVHGRSHQIVIFPHARNKIEFIASTGRQRVIRFGDHAIYFAKSGTAGNGLYQIPGELVFQDDGVTPFITAPNFWAIAVSREFRPAFQVSRLTWANGTNPESFFWDSTIDIRTRTGVAFPPRIGLNASAEADTNGGRVNWALRNPDTGDFFASDGNSSRVQFAFGMHGIGDVAGPGLGSTITPEFYNYTIDKPAGFTTVARQSYDAETSEQVIDHGDSPEAERLSVTSYDRGAYERYSERGDIPLELGDTDRNLLYFEGTAFQVHAGEARAQTPQGLHIESYGMIDNLLRMEWADTAPNFEVDPYDDQHRPYLISDALRVCFEAAGVPAEQVVIEEESAYLSGFRFWHEPTSGGGLGGGHSAGGNALGRWWPQPGLPVHEFVDHLIRKVLGWHWVRDKSDRRWHIYKRPDPQLAADVHKLVPKVEFYSDAYQRANTDIPGYMHSDLKKETKRPACTTIVAKTMVMASGLKSKADLAAALAREQSGDSHPDDTTLETSLRLWCPTAHNYLGWKNPFNPTPNVYHPDFLGRQRIKEVPMLGINSREAALWLLRRLYEDNCFGYVYRNFTADWGDLHTYNLRKWDMCLVNGAKHYIHRVEPKWGAGKDRRAHYTVSKYRTDVRPPR